MRSWHPVNRFEISGRHSNVFQLQARSIDFESYYFVVLVRMSSSIVAMLLKEALHISVAVGSLRQSCNYEISITLASFLLGNNHRVMIVVCVLPD